MKISEYEVFKFGENKLNVHLMLKGEFGFDDEVKYKIISLDFGEEKLVISDPKSMCLVSLNPMIVKVPDALGLDFTYEYFLDKVDKNKDSNVKSFLINQSIIKGIGNAYADEILFEANISPESILGAIPGDVLKKMYASIKNVLENAIKRIEEINPNIISGEERSFLKVHLKETENAINGEIIIIKKIAGKDTYFVGSQVLYE